MYNQTVKEAIENALGKCVFLEKKQKKIDIIKRKKFTLSMILKRLEKISSEKKDEYNEINKKINEKAAMIVDILAFHRSCMDVDGYC